MARQRNEFASLKYLFSRFSGQMPVVPEYSFDNNKQLQVRAAAGDRDWPLIGNDASDITQLGNPNGVNALAISTTQLATPATPTVAVLGTAGSTTWAYKIVAKSGSGGVLGVTAASTAGQTTTGNATLTAANFNTITWAATVGAASYDIYRTTAGGTPSTTGLIGNLKAQILSDQTIAPTFNDTGLTGDSTTAPTVNTTGAAVFGGPVTFASGGAFLDASSLTAITTAGAGTYTAAAMVGSGSGLNVITRDCNGSSRTDTTDTATAIITALGGDGVVAIGTSFQFLVKNISATGLTITVAAGVGVTFPNDSQLTIVSGESQPFLGRVTNVGAPAVTIYLTDSYGTAITDTSGNQLIGLNATASAVNSIAITNQSTGVNASITAAGETNAGVDIGSRGTGSVNVFTGTRKQFTVKDTAGTIINRIRVTGNVTTAAPLIDVDTTTDANVGITIAPKATGALNVTQSGNTGPGLSVVGVASAVNGLLVTPAATAGTPILSSAVSGADANSPIALSSNGTGTIDLATGNDARVQARIIDTAGTIINRLTLTGNVTTAAPIVAIDTTTDANVGMTFTPKATGAFNVKQSGNTNPGLSVVGVASAVNGLLVTPAATASPVILSSAVSGADANAGTTVSSNGTGSVVLATGNAARTQVSVLDTASAVNNFTFTGGAAGTPGIVTMTSAGSSTNIDIVATPKGSGVFIIPGVVYNVSGSALTADISAGNATAIILAGITGHIIRVVNFSLTMNGTFTTSTDIRLSDTTPTLDIITIPIADAVTGNVVFPAGVIGPTGIAFGAAAGTTLGSLGVQLATGVGLQIRKTGGGLGGGTSVKYNVQYTINS